MYKLTNYINKLINGYLNENLYLLIENEDIFYYVDENDELYNKIYDEEEETFNFNKLNFHDITIIKQRLKHNILNNLNDLENEELITKLNKLLTYNETYNYIYYLDERRDYYLMDKETIIKNIEVLNNSNKFLCLNTEYRTIKTMNKEEIITDLLNELFYSMNEIKINEFSELFY